MIEDPLDGIMHVMTQAFDPGFGEAWSRRQVADALLLANTFYVLTGEEAGRPLREASETAGFALLRHAAEEEELLLLGVLPQSRRRGIGRRLLEMALADARARGAAHMFLEMRDGNPAEYLYRAFGFEQIGRRPGYYRSAANGPIDAVTFVKRI